jgi:hypothetical protein
VLRDHLEAREVKDRVVLRQHLRDGQEVIAKVSRSDLT